MEVGVGIIGVGNVGSGTLQILAENAHSIQEKLGFPLRVKAVCSRSIHSKSLPGLDASIVRTTNWSELVAHPEVDIVAELIGGVGTAGQVIEGAFRAHKSVVTANKELMALRGAELDRKSTRLNSSHVRISYA